MEEKAQSPELYECPIFVPNRQENGEHSELNVRKLLYKDHDPYANFEKTSIALFSWGNPTNIFDEIIDLYRPKIIIEVGTFLGATAIKMAACVRKYNVATEIVCIDTWLGSVEYWYDEVFKMNLKNGRPTLYDHFLTNVVELDVQDIITPFPIDSQNGLLTLQKLGVQADLIYVDAAHHYFSVFSDITLATKIIRLGGYIVVDDYHFPDIKEAVKDALGTHDVIDNRAVWKNERAV